jgi:hypothetical protein
MSVICCLLSPCTVTLHFASSISNTHSNHGCSRLTRPDLLAPLGIWQKVNLGVCSGIYVMYTFLSLILLLNLLIALLASNFTKTQEEATLQGRLAFARIVLRLELVAHFFGVDTRATQIDDDGVEG